MIEENGQRYIETVRRGREGGGSIPGCRVVLSDGSTFFILLSDGDELGCSPGSIVDDEMKFRLREAALRWEICAKALDLLAAREHSEMELKRKLEKRFFDRRKVSSEEEGGRPEPAAVVRQVISLLKCLNYLDDIRFARIWADSRLRRHPEGPSALASGLRARGVSAEITEKIIGGFQEMEAFSDALDRAGRKLASRSGGDEEKLMKRLRTRGFGYREIKEWMENFGGQEPD